jgi:hypothetical protein
VRTDLSEHPAGLSSDKIEYLLKADADVVMLERIEGAKAMWKIAVSVDSATPVHMIADNGINEIYFQVMIQIDPDHIAEALTAIAPYAVVGLSFVGDGGLFMRSAFYVEFSNMRALTNTIRAAALAYRAYENAVSGQQG